MKNYKKSDYAINKYASDIVYTIIQVRCLYVEQV